MRPSLGLDLWLPEHVDGSETHVLERGEMLEQVMELEDHPDPTVQLTQCLRVRRSARVD